MWACCFVQICTRHMHSTKSTAACSDHGNMSCWAVPGLLALRSQLFCMQTTQPSHHGACITFAKPNKLT